MIAIEDDSVIRPNIAVRVFKNLDAALDFCRFVQPTEMHIATRYVTDGIQEVGRKEVVLQYIGTDGMM